ncbi:hypothetical protein [Demequina subtropica]|nr:hypothetical protein [Demequina subtropica]
MTVVVSAPVVLMAVVRRPSGSMPNVVVVPFWLSDAARSSA